MRVPAWNWRGIGAVASVIIVVGLLAYVFSAVGAQRRGRAAASTATVATTPTLTVATTPTLTRSTTVTGPQLSWQRVSSPSGARYAPTTVAPNDGDVAYSCEAPAQGQTNAHT